jgi:hypothetical protein
LVCHRRIDDCETDGAESQEATAPEVEALELRMSPKKKNGF